LSNCPFKSLSKTLILMFFWALLQNFQFGPSATIYRQP
jgi:hypothetical protein